MRDFKAGKSALRAFVLKISELYGIQFYKFNVHLMLYIPDSVMKFGALWASSTFPFEHYNSVLSNMFRNSQAVPEQICKSYLRLKSAEKLSWKVFSHRNCPKDVKILHEKICGKYRLEHCIEYGSHLRSCDTPKQIQLPLIIKTAIEVYLQKTIVNEAQSFNRFIYNHTLWHVESYEKLQKRHNSTVQLSNGSFITIQAIFAIRTEVNDELYYIITGNILRPINYEICRTNSFTLSSNKFFIIAFTTTQIVAISPDMLCTKCIKIPFQVQENNHC